LTDAEKGEKLEALKAEQKPPKENEEEEEWEQSKLLRLYCEATDDWTQKKPGSNMDGIKEA
jgi:hypothetical protein